MIEQRRYIHLLLSLALASSWSCDNGTQGGKFHTNGYFTIALKEDGFIVVNEGYAVGADNQPLESLKTKVFVLVLPPHIDGSNVLSGGSGIGGGRSTTEYWRNLSLRVGGTRSFSYVWDRAEHNLIIGRDRFKIDDGNVFVVTLDDAWKTKTEQSKGSIEFVCKPGTDFSDERECLVKIKELFPGNASVRNAELKYPKR